MAYSATAAEDGGQAEARRPLDRQGEGQARAHVGSLLSLPLSREMVATASRVSLLRAFILEGRCYRLGCGVNIHKYLITVLGCLSRD